MGKPKQEKPKTRQSYNAVIQMQVAARRGAAAGFLLAAEAEYLTAHGWQPHVASGPLDEGFPYVRWVSPRGGIAFQQSHAVEMVKKEDPLLLGH
jgi:hypothetical protein